MNELRKDPILGNWVIISPERGKRPQAYARLQRVIKKKKRICPLCSGNENLTPPEIYALRPKRSKPNTRGWRVRVVPNKFPVLDREKKLVSERLGIFDMMSGFGDHEVIIETPKHNKNLKNQSIKELSEVLKTFQHRIRELYKDKRLRYCLVFKNEGWEAGASLEHPHSQLIATPVIPKRIREELIGSRNYFRREKRCIYCDILSQERKSKERIVYENREYIVFCPFASRFPFEVWLLPKRHNADFCSRTTKKNIPPLADALKATMQKLASTLNNPQYNYVIHTIPNPISRHGYGKNIDRYFHWHIEIMPRLTRVAGFEWGADFYINPIAPEAAAQSLREKEIK
ncbi:galactose-1-phosphate uridylyltransferase [bacterium]|nr:galactose-1-phosphate uridylyltransferase [bacterium]